MHEVYYLKKCQDKEFLHFILSSVNRSLFTVTLICKHPVCYFITSD